MANSNLRFQQWILDTCLRPYDQDWLNYQKEIALRHTTFKKNQVDRVRSTPYVPLRDIFAFIAILNETIKPYLAAKRNSAEEVNKDASGTVQVPAAAVAALDQLIHQAGSERVVSGRPWFALP